MQMLHFEERVRAQGGTLSALQLRMVQIIRENAEQAAMMSIREFAEAAAVSQASVTRFVRKIGFDSYSDFQLYFKSQLLNKINTVDKMKNTLAFPPAVERGEVCETLWRDCSIISLFQNELSIEEVEQAASLVCKAECVYLAGLGSAKALVDFLSYRFCWMGIRVRTCTGGGTDFFENLVLLSRSDLLFCIGFRKTYREISVALDYADRQGAAVLGMAEDRAGEILSRAKAALPVRRGPEGEWNSLALPMSICNILVKSVLKRRGEEAIALAGQLQWLNDQYHYNSIH